MSTEVELCRYSRVHVHFFDVEVPVVSVGKAVYFPLPALCRVVGIGAQAQAKRIHRLEEADSRWAGALRELSVPTTKGDRPTQCLNKKQLGRWLDSIDPTICSITAKGPLERFQGELEAAADRFLFGSTGVVSTRGQSAVWVRTVCQHCGQDTSAPVEQVEWFSVLEIEE